MILVTGANGTVGREVVRQLAAAGVPVRAMVRKPSQPDGRQSPQVEEVLGDFNRAETLDAALAGVDHAYLLPPNNPDQSRQERAFIEAARRAGVQHVVKQSALGAEEPDSPVSFLHAHHAAEEFLRASGVPFTILRPGTFMQNMLASAPTIQAQNRFFMPVGDARISHVDARDIAAVAVEALTKPGHAGKTYTITGPAALTYGEVADALSQALGRTITYVPVAPREWRDNLVSAGADPWFADAMVTLLERVIVPRGTEITDTVETVAGRQPITFAQFARDHADAFRGDGSTGTDKG